MNRFLSEQAIFAHKEYVRTLRMKYSILEDSIPDIKNADIDKIRALRINNRDKEEALSLLGEIKCHDMYFTSFDADMGLNSPLARRQYGSEDALAMCILYEAMKKDVKFVSTGIKQGRISIHASKDYHTHFDIHTPKLMIDVEEHAYFWDFGFDKERYVKSALLYLNLANLG